MVSGNHLVVQVGGLMQRASSSLITKKQMIKRKPNTKPRKSDGDRRLKLRNRTLKFSKWNVQGRGNKMEEIRENAHAITKLNSHSAHSSYSERKLKRNIKAYKPKVHYRLHKRRLYLVQRSVCDHLPHSATLLQTLRLVDIFLCHSADDVGYLSSGI